MNARQEGTSRQSSASGYFAPPSGVSDPLLFTRFATCGCGYVGSSSLYRRADIGRSVSIATLGTNDRGEVHDVNHAPVVSVARAPMTTAVSVRLRIKRYLERSSFCCNGYR